MEQAKKKFEENNFRGAIQLLSEEIEKNSNLKEALLYATGIFYDTRYRGECYRWLFNHKEAIADFNKCLSIEPNFEQDKQVFYRRGESFKVLGKYDQALADFNKCLSIDPDLKYALETRGSCHHMMGNSELALIDLNKALSINPWNAYALAHRGETYRKMGNLEEAFHNLNQAIELEGSFCSFYIFRALCFEEKRDFILAMKDIDKALEINPVLKYLGMSLMQIKERIKDELFERMSL